MTPPAWPAVLATVPWSAPWYTPYAQAGQAVAAGCGNGLPLWDALNDNLGAPVRFVPQQALPRGTAYEQFIFDTGCCPTREGLHDFFNALCWSAFPATKQRLNQLQAAAIAHDGIGASRGALRDGLTLFDENAALLQAPDVLWGALAAKQWQQVFMELRPLWQQAHLLVFGHALLEKLLHPRKGHTAHVYRLQVDSRTPADIDRWMAGTLNPEALDAKARVHLPLMGVPGWCAANTNAAFYDDAGTFRAPRNPPAASAVQ